MARVAKTQGRRGEVAAELHTDIPNRFSLGMRLFGLAENGSRRELKVEELWGHKEWLVLKFAGVDTISEAEELSGCELQVPAEERARLDEGWNFVSDLAGCVVFDGVREIGTVQDVQMGAGEAPLLIVRAATGEYEIPYAEAYLKHLDLEHRRIEMELPEGMLEVNAPLNAEEKAQQRTAQREAGRAKQSQAPRRGK